MPDRSLSSPALSSRRAIGASPSRLRLSRANVATGLVDHHDVDASCRRLVRALGEAGFLAPRGDRAAWRGGAFARRAHALPRARDAGRGRGARRLRLRHAGARHGARVAVRHERAEGALAAGGRQGRADRRLRALRARGRVGSGRHDDDGRRRRQCAFSSRRRQDLDIERRHRRSLRGFLPHRRSRRTEGAFGRDGRGRHARPCGRRAPRDHRAPSARDLVLRGLPGADRQSHRRPGGGLQGRHGDARRVPLDGRGGGSRLRASRASRRR